MSRFYKSFIHIHIINKTVFSAYVLIKNTFVASTKSTNLFNSLLRLTFMLWELIITQVTIYRLKYFTRCCGDVDENGG